MAQGNRIEMMVTPFCFLPIEGWGGLEKLGAAARRCVTLLSDDHGTRVFFLSGRAHKLLEGGKGAKDFFAVGSGGPRIAKISEFAKGR